MSFTRRNFFGRSRRQSKRRGSMNRSRRRFAHLERLEDRVLLAADVNPFQGLDNPWHNRLVPGDVDGDFRVTPLDALMVINSLNREGPRKLDTLLFSGNGGEGEAAPVAGQSVQMLDVNNDGYLTPIDALQVINLLNQGEGEGPAKLVRAESVVTEYYRPDYLGEQPVQRSTIDTANPGDTILVNVFAADIREDDGVPGDTDEFGIFAAYFDVHFDSLAFTVPPGQGFNENRSYDFPILFVNPAHPTIYGSIAQGNRVSTDLFNFPNGGKGTLNQAEGRIAEAGGFSGRLAPLGRDIPAVPQDAREIFLNQHVFDVPFTIESLYAMDDTAEVDAGSSVEIDVLANDGLVYGEYSFGLSGSSGVGNEILTFGDNATESGDTGRGSVVPEANVEFVQGMVEIPQGERELTFVGLVSGPSHGSVDGSNGLMTYTPNQGFSGTDSFVYRVSDGTNNTKTATVTITVNPLNEPPEIAAPGAVEFDEDTVLDFTGDHSVTITDADDDPLDVTLTATSPITLADGSGVTFTDEDGADGTLAFSGTQAQVNAALAGLTYTPAPNFYGSGQVVITATDNINDPVSHTIELTVRPINDPPSLHGVPDEMQTLQIDELPWTITTITVSDELDAQFAPEGDVVNRLTLHVSGGTLTVQEQPTQVDVTGNGTATVTIEGMTQEINTLLGEGVAFDGPVGEVTFTATLNDLGNVDWRGEEAALEVEESFLITVVPPTRPFAANDSFTVLEDSGPTEFDVLQNDYDLDSEQGGENLQIVEISQPANGTVAIVSEGAAVVYTPDDDYFGTDTFTYTIIDTSDPDHEEGDGPSTATVTVNVLPVNDPPSFTAEDPPEVWEDAGLQEIEGWVTEFIPGPPNESHQEVLEYIVSDITKPDLFSVAPSVSPDGTLTYQSAPDAFGVSEFTVVVRDDGGTEHGGIDTSEPQTFTITVLSVNDPPTFTASDPPEIHEDAGPQVIENWATDFVPGPPNESDQELLGYHVIEVTNQQLFAELPEVDLEGTLTYTPADDAFGTATFTVVAQDDGGTERGGDDTSAPQTFTITVLPVNDPPTFVADDPPAVLEDAGPQEIEGWVTEFIPGPPNESDQEVLAYHVTDVSNEALFAELPSVSLDGTLTYESAPDAWGTSTFTVVVQDDGGTERGGEDMSEPQTFTITVLAVNDPPVNRLNGDPIGPDDQLFTNNDFDLAFTAANQARLTVTDVDDDGSETFSVELSVTNGELLFGLEDEPAASKEISARSLSAVNEKLGTLIFRPAEGFIGEAVLTIASNDGGTFGEGPAEGWTTEDELVISVAPFNRPPIAADDDIEMDEGGVAVFSVFDDNGHGPDSAGPNEDDFQSIQVISFDTTGTVGTVELLDDETGEFRYTPPDEYWNGVTSFTYTIQDDGQSLIDGEIVDDFKTDSATVTITVWEVNNPPIAEDDLVLIDPQPEAGQEFVFLASELLANDLPGPPNESDQTLSIVSVSTSALGATVTLVPGDTGDPGDDQIIYTVPAGFEHADTFEYTVQDDGTTRGEPDPRTDTATVTVRDVVLSTISGYVYVDSAGSGEPTSERLGGVLVQLSGTDLTGNPVDRETRTAEDGSYAFTNLMPSMEGTEYLVTQQQPIGWMDGYVSAGNNGAVVRDDNVIGIHLPLIGLDSANPDQSESRHNNFAEYGLSADFGLITLRDLLYSGNDNHATGWVFATDADNQLQWYMNLSGWEGYVPGVESSSDPGVYTVDMSGDSFPVTNHQRAEVEQLNVNSLARFRQSTHGENGATITHLIGSPHHFDLLNDVHDPLDDGQLDLLAGGEGEADYSAAVDAVFADLL